MEKGSKKRLRTGIHIYDIYDHTGYLRTELVGVIFPPNLNSRRSCRFTQNHVPGIRNQLIIIRFIERSFLLTLSDLTIIQHYVDIFPLSELKNI